MNSLTPRILALPADVRATLAGVDGPGWLMSPERDGDRMWTSERGWHTERLPAVCSVFASFKAPMVADVIDCCTRYGCGWAFFPANPATAVAAVTRCDMFRAHSQIVNQINVSEVDDDIVAALSIIEAHVADRSPNV